MITIALTTLDDRYITVNADHIITMEAMTTGTELRLTNSITMTVKETVIEINILLQDGYKIADHYKH
jgi:uncharacterized protein YlzI (FlbEa/FlbD family)